MHLKVVITLADYFQGKDLIYRRLLTEETTKNAETLLSSVNSLLHFLKVSPSVSSGWRPAPANEAAKGAKASYHLIGRAIDLRDPSGALGYNILQNYPLLDELGLWLEYPRFTNGWVHLDTGTRAARNIRTFIP